MNLTLSLDGLSLQNKLHLFLQKLLYISIIMKDIKHFPYMKKMLYLFAEPTLKYVSWSILWTEEDESYELCVFSCTRSFLLSNKVHLFFSLAFIISTCKNKRKKYVIWKKMLYLFVDPTLRLHQGQFFWIYKQYQFFFLFELYFGYLCENKLHQFLQKLLYHFNILEH